MTTRRQIILLLMPLFIGLAICGGALGAWLELRAEQRDFDTEVRTLASSIAEFMMIEELPRTESEREAAEVRLREIFNRILRWQQALRIFLIDSDGRILGDTAGPATPATVDLSLQPAEGEVTLQPIANDGAEHQVRPAMAQTRHPSWRVGIEVSARPFLDRRRLIWRDYGIMTLWTLGIGIIATFAFAAFVSREFKRLGYQAGLLGTPEFQHSIDSSRIREIADVGNILRVMHGVLRETLEKTQRALIDRQFVRNDRTLAEVFAVAEPIPDSWHVEDVAGVVRQIGFPEAVQGRVALPDGGAAFIGLMPENLGFETNLTARTARAYLSAALVRLPLEQAARETLEMFGLRELAVVRWQGGTITQWQRRGFETAISTTGDFPTGSTRIAMCLDQADRDRVALFRQAYPAMPFDQLVENLPGLLHSDQPGMVLFLHRSAPSPAST